ncbi:MAG: hypothetical protein JO314_10945, partial [Acidobacteria bacterium]|nr:hypothetical protein [Acidobacteriota bacterium]
MTLNGKLALSLLCVILGILAFGSVISAQQKDPTFALQRGYRTGYSDGYMAGYRDTIDSVARDYTRHDEYVKADRTYAKDYGALEDFRDGYQQGFESGYDTGFDRRSFESSMPAGLKKRGVMVGDRKGELIAQTPTQTPTQTTQTTDTYTSTTDTNTNTSPTETAPIANTNAVILIPKDTELILELQNELSTEHNREGDKFTAKIVSPSELNGATIEGRVSKVTKPGRIKRRGELSLSFDRILLSDNRW